MLSYCLRVALALISSPRFRSEVSLYVPINLYPYLYYYALWLLNIYYSAVYGQVLHVLVKKYEELHIPDYINICQVRPDSICCLFYKCNIFYY